ncbi:MAG: hypothetical protein IIA67_10505 [Planctomycetes bacterium]|nr:hypothetical protein [Planctomycetota bacterium]
MASQPDDSASAPGLIPEVYQQHLAEFQALWTQRQEMLSSPELTAGDLDAWEDRIGAHRDALLLPDEEAVIPLVAGGLAEEDTEMVFGAAYVLLKLKSQWAASLVGEAFGEAEGDRLAGIGQALCHAPIALLESTLRQTVESDVPPRAVVAAEALAFHHKLRPEEPRLGALLGDEDPAVREAAWRVVAAVDGR